MSLAEAAETMSPGQRFRSLPHSARSRTAERSTLGTTFVGTAVNRTFTVRNSGTAILALTRLSTLGLPKGFTIASNLSKLSLEPGQTAVLLCDLTPQRPVLLGGRSN